MYSDSGCDLICNLKTHSADILSQTIRILLKNTVYSLSVLLINLCPQIQRNPVFLQKDHGTAHICLLSHLFCDLHCFFLADPFNLCQTFRFFLHDPYGIISETSYNPCSKCRTDSLNSTGAQITLHRKSIFRHFLRVRRNLKLSAINRVCCIISHCFYGRPLGKSRKISHAGQFRIILRSLHHHDGISIIFISKDHMIYISCNCFTHLILHLSYQIIMQKALHLQRLILYELYP